MPAQKNTRVLLNTHSRRVHLQRIGLQLLCTPTHAHAFAAALCTPETQTHTLMHRVMHFSARAASASQNQLRCVFLMIALVGGGRVVTKINGGHEKRKKMLNVISSSGFRCTCYDKR